MHVRKIKNRNSEMQMLEEILKTIADSLEEENHVYSLEDGENGVLCFDDKNLGENLDVVSILKRPDGTLMIDYVDDLLDSCYVNIRKFELSSIKKIRDLVCKLKKG